MEPSQDNPVQKKGSIWLKIAIAFLVIASIGQISAIFIPASIGESPPPTSLLGSLLWLGLLFMCIWALKNKAKYKGFLLGALIGFLLDFSGAFIAGYVSAETRAIDEAVAKSNESLPKMIDEETRLDSASIDQVSKNYYLNISLVNLSLAEIDTAILDENYQQYIKPTSCNNEAFKLFFSEGYTVNYVYKNKSGELIRKYAIKPVDCEA